MTANPTAPASLEPLKPRHQPRIQPSGKVKGALDAMVWRGLRRDDAAKANGLLPKSLYHALQKAHVKAYYAMQLDVLRNSERARSIHRLAEIRDAANNMPAVQSARVLLETEHSQAAATGQGLSAGLVIVIGNQTLPARYPNVQTVDTKANDTNDLAAPGDGLGIRRPDAAD